MLSPLLKTAIFLGLSLLANARPQAFNVQSDGFTIGKVDDWVSSGNYLIYSCSSRAPGIKDLLVDSYLYLQNAILSTDTAPYKAFFHNAYPVPITQVLRHMADGTNMTDVVLKSSRPTIVCANPTDPGLSTAWKLCSEADNRILLQPPGTAYVFLCPSFFDKKRTPEHSDCATVSPDRTRLLMQTHIAQSQYGFLVHALADMYIRKITHFGHAREPDVREVNKCLALPPEKALRNPSSYAIYASSKSFFILNLIPYSISIIFPGMGY